MRWNTVTPVGCTVIFSDSVDAARICEVLWLGLVLGLRVRVRVMRKLAVRAREVRYGVR